MAQADERKPDFKALTSDHLPASRTAELPAHRDEREEPGAPVEQRDVQREHGRSPEEVLADQEDRQPKRTDDTEDLKPPARKIRVKGQELTISELAKRPDLLEALAITAEQLPSVQQKYQKLLEGLTEKALEKKAGETQAAKPAPRVTQVQIRQQFDPMVKQAVAEGYIEPDFAEAYPDLTAGLMYFRTIVEALDGVVGQLRAWVGAEVDLRNARMVESTLGMVIDQIAVRADDEKNKDARLYRPLKNPEVRSDFVKWLKTDVDPKVGALNVDNMDRFWKAYNAAALLEIANTEKREPVSSNRQRAKGDGTGARVGAPPELPQKPTILDSLIAQTGKFPSAE